MTKTKSNPSEEHAGIIRVDVVAGHQKKDEGIGEHIFEPGISQVLHGRALPVVRVPRLARDAGLCRSLIGSQPKQSIWIRYSCVQM